MASPAITTRGDTGAAIEPDRAVPHQVVLVRVGDWAGAIPVDHVEQVLPAVSIHSAGRSTGDLLGHVNVHGVIVPVADARSMLGLPRRPIALADHLLLLSTSSGPVIAPVDEALGVAIVRSNPSDARPLRPVQTEGGGEPVITLIDPDGVFGAVALRTIEADPSR
jgi:chemotaxis signal transduction protein